MDYTLAPVLSKEKNTYRAIHGDGVPLMMKSMHLDTKIQQELLLRGIQGLLKEATMGDTIFIDDTLKITAVNSTGLCTIESGVNNIVFSKGLPIDLETITTTPQITSFNNALTNYYITLEVQAHEVEYAEDEAPIPDYTDALVRQELQVFLRQTIHADETIATIPNDTLTGSIIVYLAHVAGTTLTDMREVQYLLKNNKIRHENLVNILDDLQWKDPADDIVYNIDKHEAMQIPAGVDKNSISVSVTTQEYSSIGKFSNTLKSREVHRIASSKAESDIISMLGLKTTAEVSTSFAEDMHGYHGNATGGSVTTLVDSGADFLTTGVEVTVGAILYNNTQKLSMVVTGVATNTLTFATAVAFSATDEYMVALGDEGDIREQLDLAYFNSSIALAEYNSLQDLTDSTVFSESLGNSTQGLIQHRNAIKRDATQQIEMYNANILKDSKKILQSVRYFLSVAWEEVVNSVFTENEGVTTTALTDNQKVVSYKIKVMHLRTPLTTDEKTGAETPPSGLFTTIGTPAFAPVKVRNVSTTERDIQTRTRQLSVDSSTIEWFPTHSKDDFTIEVFPDDLLMIYIAPITAMGAQGVWGAKYVDVNALKIGKGTFEDLVDSVASVQASEFEVSHDIYTRLLEEKQFEFDKALANTPDVMQVKEIITKETT